MVFDTHYCGIKLLDWFELWQNKKKLILGYYYIITTSLALKSTNLYVRLSFCGCH